MQRRQILTALTLATLGVAGALVPQPGLAQGGKGTITFTITGFRNAKGHALADLYKSSDGFPDSPKKALRNLSVSIKDGKATFVFKDVPFGKYAISVMHDENDDKDLETNWYGKPLEGVCTSRNAEKKSSGAPDYEDAEFALATPSLMLDATMSYY